VVPTPTDTRIPVTDEQRNFSRHFQIIVAVVFALSVLKGIRMPNLWSATHLTFNYSQGFVRRGLVGAVIKGLGGERMFTYNRLALLSVVIFVLTVVAMARLAGRLLQRGPNDVALLAALLVFAASPGVVFLAHEIGYLDYLGLLAVLGLIFLSQRTSSRIWNRYFIFYVGALLGIILAFIHESMVVMFVPTMLFVMICHILSQRTTHNLSRATRAAMWVHVLAVGGISFAASNIVGLAGTRPPSQIQALQRSIATMVNFPLRTDAFDALSRPVKENLHVLMPWFWKNASNRAYLINSLIVVSPGLIFLFAYGVLLIRRLPVTRVERLILSAVFLGATFGPLSLNFVGWDAARWNAICLLASLLCIASLRLFFVGPRADGADLAIKSPWLVVAAALAIVLGLGTSYERFLFDGYVVHWFPFDGQWNAAVELVRGHFSFIPRM